MKKLKFREPYNHHYEYSGDIDRIVKIFADRGYEISSSDAVCAWEAYSENMCAGWMSLDYEDRYVFDSAFSYFEEVK